MTLPKFPLKMNDGSEVRSLEELREHANFATVAGRYDDGALRRWLRTWGFAEEAEKIEKLDSEDKNVYKALYDALDIPWTEDVQSQLIQYIDNINDEIARLLNYNNDSFQFVETDDYVFLNSDSLDKPVGWTILSKRKCKNMGFQPSEEDKKRLPSAVESHNITTLEDALAYACSLFFPSERKTDKLCACGNQVLWNDSEHLYALDLTEGKIKEIVSLDGSTFSGLLAGGAGGRIAYGLDLGEDEWGESTGALLLRNLKDGTTIEVTAQGEPIKASGAILTKDALFFVCENSEMFLDNGEDPCGCVCRYDLASGDCRVLAKVKTDDFLPNIIGSHSDWLYLCGMHDEDYYYCIISATEPTEAVSYQWLSEDIRANHNLDHEETYCGMGMFAFRDGFVFLGGSEKTLHLCFLDFATGEKRFFLLADTVEKVARLGASTWFRLGNWLYYSLEKDDKNNKNMPRERWKISLETGKQVQLPCEN